MKKFRVKGFRIILFCWMVGMTGCLGVDIEGDHPMQEDPTRVFVEATISYPGPFRQWVGPQDFTIKLTTLKHGSAQIVITPPIEFLNTALKSKRKGEGPLSIEAAREEMNRLSTALNMEESPFAGCLLPVHVQLIRADGAMINRKGCRSQLGWPRFASEIVNHLIELKTYTHHFNPVNQVNQVESD